jgi:signal transduction histidine kinase
MNFWSISRKLSTERIINPKLNPHSKVWLTSPLIAEYSERSVNAVTIDYLMEMEGDIQLGALFLHKELPVRLARRVRAIERLPFIVGVNPYISQVYDMYRDSFHRLLACKPPSDHASLQQFTQVLAELTHSHQAVIPNLARGFMEAGNYMPTERKQRFLDEMISARIGIRVLAEHFLALHKPKDGWIGIVNTEAKPRTILESICQHVQHICDLNYGSYPNFEITGCVDTKFAYINVHMEYIFMELIKNAMRATGGLILYSRIFRFDAPAGSPTSGNLYRNIR